MFRTQYFLVAAALLIAVPAATASSDSAETASPAAVTAMEMLAASAAAAKDAGDLRWAFTARYKDLADDTKTPLTARYDPRLPDGEWWKAVSPTGDDLEKDQVKFLKQMNKAKEPADETLVYDKIGDMAARAELVSETSEEAVFSARVEDEDMPDEMKKALVATLILNKSSGVIRDVTVRAAEPFKPAAVAKVERFTQTQTYAQATPEWPPLLARSEMNVSGKAMFKSFEQHILIEYSDYELVEVDSDTVN